jgi:hypothetical protein
VRTAWTLACVSADASPGNPVRPSTYAESSELDLASRERPGGPTTNNSPEARMAARTNPVTIPSGLRLTRDLNDALTTWSSSQRVVIGLAADFAESGEWAVTSAVSAAHWIASVAADIEVCHGQGVDPGGQAGCAPCRCIAALFDSDELSYSKVRTLSSAGHPGERGAAGRRSPSDVPAGHSAACDRGVAAPQQRRRTSWSATSTSSDRSRGAMSPMAWWHVQRPASHRWSPVC